VTKRKAKEKLKQIRCRSQTRATINFDFDRLMDVVFTANAPFDKGCGVWGVARIGIGVWVVREDAVFVAEFL